MEAPSDQPPHDVLAAEEFELPAGWTDSPPPGGDRDGRVAVVGGAFAAAVAFRRRR